MKNILKYSNTSILYDLQDKKHLNLKDILTMLQNGTEFRVVSAPGQKDLTNDIIATALLKWAKNRSELTPVLLNAFLNTKVAA